jgi:hypothetical protein
MTMTIAVPSEAMVVNAAPPALITRHNVAHVGLTARQLLDVLRAMRLDPLFAGEVVSYGKAVRGAPPASLLAFMRAKGSSAAATPANDAAPVNDVAALAAELGLEPAARKSKSGGR